MLLVGAWSGHRFPYRTSLHQFCIDILVGRSGCDLQDNLDEATRKILDEDKLTQGLLQQRLKVSLSGACMGQ